ncbi:ferrous iron transporter B [Gemella cuniculi]
MKKNILYLMGNPNVGKSTLLLEFRKDPRFFVPKHVTNRKKEKTMMIFIDL